MKRNLKNIIMILIIIILLGCSYFTMNSVQSNNSQISQNGLSSNGENLGTPPQMS